MGNSGTRMIADFLTEGKSNAVSSQRLTELAGCKSVRELQQIIAAERAAGAVILSTAENGGGYSCQKTQTKWLNLTERWRVGESIHWQH